MSSCLLVAKATATSERCLSGASKHQAPGQLLTKFSPARAAVLRKAHTPDLPWAVRASSSRGGPVRETGQRVPPPGPSLWIWGGEGVPCGPRVPTRDGVLFLGPRAGRVGPEAGLNPAWPDHLATGEGIRHLGLRSERCRVSRPSEFPKQALEDLDTRPHLT